MARAIFKTRCKNADMPWCDKYFIRKGHTHYCPACWERYNKKHKKDPFCDFFRLILAKCVKK